MCLYVHPDHKEVRMAEKDIHVWKIISISNESAYLHFKYTKNTTYKTAMKAYPSFVSEKVKVDEGFHAYLWKPRINHHSVFPVFSVAGNIPFVDSHGEYKIVEFIIPEGALYYEGLHGDIVSNKITSGSLEAIDTDQ